MVASQIDITAPSAVPAVGSAVRHIFGSVKVYGATSAFSRPAVYLHIINEITFSHCIWINLFFSEYLYIADTHPLSRTWAGLRGSGQLIDDLAKGRVDL